MSRTRHTDGGCGFRLALLALAFAWTGSIAGTALGAAAESPCPPPFARVTRLDIAPPMDSDRMIYSWQWAVGFCGMIEAGGAQGPRFLGSGYDAGWRLGYHEDVLYVGMMIPTPDVTTFFKADATRDGDPRIAEDDHLMVQLSARDRAGAASGKSLRIRLNINGAILAEEVEFLPGQTRIIATDSLRRLVSDKQESPGANWFTAKLAIPAALLDLTTLKGQTLLAQLAFSAPPLSLSWGGGQEGDWTRAGELLLDPESPANVLITPGHPRLFNATAATRSLGLNFSANGSFLRGDGGKLNVTIANRANDKELFTRTLSHADADSSSKKYRLPLQTAFDVEPAAVNAFSIQAIHQAADGKETLLLRQALPFQTADAALTNTLTAWRLARKKTKLADFDADYIFAPYTDQLEVTVATTVLLNTLADTEKEKGAAISAADRFEVEVLDSQGTKVAGDAGTVAAQKGRLVLALPAPFPNGTYAVNYRLLKGEQDIGKKTLRLTRERFPWEKNTLGKDKVVVPPFEPVKVEGQTVSVWGRRHLFDKTGFPKAIASQALELLDGPITLRGRVDGKEAELVPAGTPRIEKVPGQMIPPSFAEYEYVKGACPEPKLLPTDGYQATVSADNKLGALDVRVGAVVEYEGWCKFTVTLQPAGTTRVDRLDLVIPVSDSATIMKWYNETDRTWAGHGRIPAGEGVLFDSTRMPKSFGVLNSLIPIVYLGQPDRGLWTFLESDQGWSVGDTNPLTSLVREKGRLSLRYHIVDTPTDLAQPRTFDIVFMASPARPRPRNYRGIFWKNLFSHDAAGFRYYGSGVNGFTLYTDEDYEGLRKFIYESQGRYTNKAAVARTGGTMTLYGSLMSASAGMKEFATFGSSWIFTADLRKQYKPEMQFKGRKSNGGTYTYETDEQLTPIGTPTDQAYIDCNLWHMAQIARRCGINGTFYDNYKPFPPERYRNVTDLTGVSWRRPDGSIQPKSVIFRKHEWQKRAAIAFWLMGRPPHFIGGNEPESSFESNWFVEGGNDVEGSSDFIHDGKDIDKYAAWVVRTGGLGLAGPSIQEIVGADGVKRPNVRGIRVYVAYCLLLDQPMRRKGWAYVNDTLVKDICEALEREVGFFADARHLPYWRDTAWLKAAPQGLLVGGFLREDGKKAVLVAINTSEAAIDGALTVDAAKLIGGKATRAYDMESDGKASLLDGDRICVRLESHAVRFVVME